MSDEILIHRMPKNAREHIRVSLGEFKGAKHVSVRLWYADGDEEKPTAKGVNFKLDQFDELVDAVTKARAEALRLGWIERAAA